MKNNPTKWLVFFVILALAACGKETPKGSIFAGAISPTATAPVKVTPPQPAKVHKLNFTLPDGWEVRDRTPQPQGEYTILMVFGKGNEVQGMYMRSNAIGVAGDAEMKELLGGYKEGLSGTPGLGSFKASEPIKLTWGGTRQDCRAVRTRDGVGFIWASVFAPVDKKVDVMCVIITENDLPRYKEEIDNFFNRMTIGESDAPPEK